MAQRKKIQILLIEDEDFDVRRVRNTVVPFNDTIEIAEIISDGKKAVEILSRVPDRFDVVIMDFQIAGGLMGEHLIHKIKSVDPTVQIIVITKMTVNIADYAFANKLIQAGAFWYCTKYPGDIEEYIYQPTDFILAIINAYQKRLLEKEKMKTNSKILRSIEGTLQQKQIIGTSEKITSLQEQILKCAHSDANVLISGHSGTGKELVALNIHYHSARRFENFVPINCGGIPLDLVESELFGYEKGSFTGAQQSKQGLFEVANHGTIFLDEIGELPAEAQVKLLRVIQEGEIEKIGRKEPIKVDVRLIAATNKNLEKEIEQGRFREDLFYRINVIPIRTPSLQERPEDIPSLVDHFLREFCTDMGKAVPTFDPEAIQELQKLHWKGNVRELKNVIQRILFFDHAHVTRDSILQIVGAAISEQSSSLLNFAHLPQNYPLRDLEKDIRKTYVEYVRNMSSSDADAAKKLGIAPSNYHRLCKDLGIK